MDQETACSISHYGRECNSAVLCLARIGMGLATYWAARRSLQSGLLRWAIAAALMDVKHNSEIGAPFIMIEAMNHIEVSYGKEPLLIITRRPDYFLF